MLAVHKIFEDSSLFVHLILTDKYDGFELILPGDKLVKLKRYKPISLTKASLKEEARKLISDYLDKGFIKVHVKTREKSFITEGEVLEHEVTVPRENKLNEVSVEGITIAMPSKKSKDDISYNINETLEKVDEDAVYWHGVLVTEDNSLDAVSRKHRPTFWERFKAWLSQSWTYILARVRRTSQ